MKYRQLVSIVLLGVSVIVFVGCSEKKEDKKQQEINRINQLVNDR